MILKDDIFRLEYPQPQPTQGGLLIAEPFLNDSQFHRACICLTKYAGGKQSTGLILNNRLNIPLNDLISEISIGQPIPLFCGGPVSIDRLFFLHDLGRLIPDSDKIRDNLFFNGNFNAALEYINSGLPIDGHLKFFLGYSGWETGQLDEEINNHVWAVCNDMTDKEYLKPIDTDSYWHDCVRKLGNGFSNWLLCPSDPSLN